jgi:two-component system CheB/CheR fusion protein
VLLAAAVLAAVIFVVDVRTPLGTDLGVLYVIPLLLTAFSGRSRVTPAAAAIASVLTITGAFLSPAGNSLTVAATNRVVALIVIWITAAIIARFRRTGVALDRRTKDLADVNDAIDQSAIVARTDQKGRITYVNEKFCEISKYSREELLGQDHRILNSGYHPKEFMRTLWHTIANGRIWRGEIRNRAKDGSIYWVDTTIVPFLDARGHPYQYMAIRYEITERKRQEELLREQAALARLGEMAAVVAHEVKNPIAGIRGALQVITSRMPADQRDRTIMGDVIARLDALNGIVSDLLLFARPRKLRTEPVDIAALIGNTTELIRRDPAAAGIDVRINGATTVVQADPELLQIVFQNIVMNAAQAMGGKGRIDIAIDSADGRCRVSVADHGPGMPPDVRAKAFEAFFTTKHRGTGLGLPIARRIVEGHGGRIEIDTPAEGGTLVSVELPTAQRP